MCHGEERDGEGDGRAPECIEHIMRDLLRVFFLPRGRFTLLAHRSGISILDEEERRGVEEEKRGEHCLVVEAPQDRLPPRPAQGVHELLRLVAVEI